MDILLVDFGATRVKCALWSHVRQQVLAVREAPAPHVIPDAEGRAEAPAEAYWQALEATAGALLADAPEAGQLWLCTEMHGMVLADPGADPAAQRYISWKDERASRGPASTLSRLVLQRDRIAQLSGMQLRPGLPLVTLAHLAIHGARIDGQRLFSLADYLVWRGGEPDPGVHASLAAGTALFDVRTGTWSNELLACAGVAPDCLRLPRIVPAGELLGHIRLAGRRIGVYGGIGDLQAAVHGAGFPELAPAILNLGTGSQVLTATPGPVGDLRPGAAGHSFGAITHIPSGRALNVFAHFFDDCAAAAGGQAFFWSRFCALDTASVLAAPASVELGVFEAAWRYQGGGAIGSIREGSFDLACFLPALARSWLSQYAAALDQLDPQCRHARFLLAGGLSRRAPFILPVLEQLCGRSGQPAAGVTGEDTLDGLLALARSHGA